MAYAALVSLAQTLEKLILDREQYSISHHKQKEIRSTWELVISLQKFLEVFPEKASNLEGRIRDVANEAEDIIENFMWEQIRLHLRPTKWTTFLPDKLKFNFQLKKVREEIDSITKRVIEIQNNNTKSIIEDESQLGDSVAASSSSPTGAGEMVGFDGDLIEIKSQLCGELPELQVIPVVGMGGIGKTTLARNAYYDPLAMQHFDIRAWVTVSQHYNQKQILSSLFASMKLSDYDISRVKNELIEQKVYKSLKSRRYLIVMDDMWSTKAWDEVRNLFPNDNNGSRIVLTTRLCDVATYPNSFRPPHEMHLLDEEQSWNLLRQKLFKHQKCPPQLEEIGRMIAGSCKGLPLAIVVVAGLLSTISKTRAAWLKIAENVSLAVTAQNGQFGDILSLSYTHLPHYLRLCFLYLGGFPQGHEVRVSRLVKLWVAEGFMKHENGSKCLEEEAEECVEDLVKRNLVLVTKRKSNGRIKSCSLHDLVRDLCIRKAHEEKFLVNLGGVYVEEFLAARGRKGQRRISSIPDGIPYLSRIYGSTIHTIMCFGDTPLPSFESFRLLRVLNVEGADVEPLPPQLFELFHLRYLAINYGGMIPAAISKLQNLQTLIIFARGRWEFRAIRMDCLPGEIWKMPRLRHIFFYGRLPDPEGITCILENLLTLSSLSHYMLTEGFLKRIPNLKKLEIDCYDYQDDGCLNNLVHLHQLEILELRSSIFSNAVWRKDSFTFPTMLKKLTLSGLQLGWDEMSVVGSLPNLQVLKLRDFSCKGSTWETKEGEFGELEFLLVEQSDLQHWETESSHLPRLKYLILRYCWYLRNIPDDIGEIPTLELIEVKKCNEQLVESAKQIQEEQRSWGNDAIQVRC